MRRGWDFGLVNSLAFWLLMLEFLGNRNNCLDKDSFLSLDIDETKR